MQCPPQTKDWAAIMQERRTENDIFISTLLKVLYTFLFLMFVFTAASSTDEKLSSSDSWKEDEQWRPESGSQPTRRSPTHPTQPTLRSRSRTPTR